MLPSVAETRHMARRVHAMPQFAPWNLDSIVFADQASHGPTVLCSRRMEAHKVHRLIVDSSTVYPFPSMNRGRIFAPLI